MLNEPILSALKELQQVAVHSNGQILLLKQRIDKPIPRIYCAVDTNVLSENAWSDVKLA